MINGLVLVTALLCAGLFLHPALARVTLWRASITPLASIIGSGFLVLGPILLVSFGAWGPVVMLALCVLAYGFGTALRFNILRIALQSSGRSKAEARLEPIASWVLSFAYVVSVAYYLNLFGAFFTEIFGADDPIYAKSVATAVLILILIVGWARGFHALEWMETVSVSVKLSIIGGLMAGLIWFFMGKVSTGAVVIAPASVTGWPAVFLVAGLLVTVQGFETARYMGADYDPGTRVRSMRLAQLVSAAIYLVYIGLISFSFAATSTDLSETAVIGLMAQVAPVLPVLLVLAALSAQFSAAVADTGGAGGLIAELTGNRISARMGYAMLAAIGIALTWSADLLQIISYASRAFALYYGLQALIAVFGARAAGRPLACAGFAAFGIAGFCIAIFATSVE